MVSALVAQFGLSGEAPFILKTEDRLCNVFHVEEALDSAFVPDQAEFVRPYGVRSVLGFGGLLPEDEVFAVILFCSVHVGPETAELFRLVAPSVGLALAATRRDRESLEYRLRATEELLRHHERLALLRCAREEEFLSLASHELRTPLAVLQLGMQHLLRSPESTPGGPTWTASLERMERATKRLTDFSEQLVEVSRGSMAPLHLEPEEVDLSSLVREVLAGMVDVISRSGCEVCVRASGSAAGRWDRRRLEQVVTNLLTNALKFGCKKPVVVNVDGVTEARVRLSVSDQGVGIPRHEQSRIFERFQRAVSDRHYGGFGLGLWIARQVVEAHGGTIAVASAPGAGATFTVELPRRGGSLETATISC